MARPLRLQFAGAFYHVIARGNAKQDIFLAREDRELFLARLDQTAQRQNWRILVYCLMPNHYHVFLQTVEPSLARGMRDLNSRYAQTFNHRYQRVGHLFQGRYKAILVERAGYVVELVRYIVLNPVRAGLCATASEWDWSSHRATLGLARPIQSLDVDFLLGVIDSDPARSRKQYAEFVTAGETAAGPQEPTTQAHPIVLGTDTFINLALDQAPRPSEVPRAQRASQSLAGYAREFRRNEAIQRAYASGAYSLAQIGRHFGLHYSTVSRICGAAGLRPSGSGTSS